MTVAIESNTHITLASVLLHVKETGRKRSSARLTPCAMFKTSYLEATACQVQSNFNLLRHSPGFKPLLLHPLTQLVQGSHTSCLVSCLESAQFLAVLTVFQFRNGRGPICNPCKGEQLLSGDGLTFFSCTNVGLCPLGKNGFRSIVFLTLLCSRKGCCNWPNQFPFMAEQCRKSGFLTGLSKQISKECLMLAARTLH